MIPEVVSQVAYLIIGHDYTITMAAEAGQLELNAFEPVLFHHHGLNPSILSKRGSHTYKHCIAGITATAMKGKNILKKVLESQQRYVHISDMQSQLRLQRNH